MSEKKDESEELAAKKPRDSFDLMEEMFEEFRKNWMTPYPPMRGMRRAFNDLLSRTKTDLIDNPDSYELHMDVPGIPKDKLSINVTEDGVEISGKAETSKEDEKRNYLFRERQYSEVYRKVDLSDEIVPERTEAHVKDGVLIVRMPKKQPKPLPKAHKVQVR